MEKLHGCCYYSGQQVYFQDINIFLLPLTILISELLEMFFDGFHALNCIPLV